LLITTAAGCAGSRRTVSRTAADTAIDLSGRWNDTDSQMVAQSMIGDCLSKPWLARFSEDNDGNVPDVILGTVRNRSSEHIPVNAFLRELEAALVNSGKVNFVADSGARRELRAEREDQAHNASDESMKGPGQEAGADYMLQGTLNSIEDVVEGAKVVYYQVDLELVDIANNRKVWINQKKIKKVVEQSGVSL
jgi:hypothetical protein